MKNWFCYLLISSVTLSIFGCSGVNFSQWHFPYMMEVQQGKYITTDQINQLHNGMTKEQVSFIIGHPQTQFLFNQNRWDFIYQDYKNYELKKNYTVTILFDSNNQVYNITKSGPFFDK